METLEPNISALIISYLDNDSVNVLNSLLPEIVTAAKDTNVYWHQKTELLLGKQLPLGIYNWKDIYNILELGVDDESWFSLAVTASNGSVQAIKLLMDIGKDPSMERNNAVKKASERGYINIIELLLEDTRVSQSSEINFALIGAVENQDTKIVELLLNKSIADPSFNNNESLDQAIRYRCVDIINILLKDKRIIPESDLIFRYSREWNPEAIKLLLKDGRSDPSFHNNYTLVRASDEQDIDIIKLLLIDPRVDSSVNYYAPIINSIYKGNLNIIKLLYEHGSIIFYPNPLPPIYTELSENSVKGMIAVHYFTHDKFGEQIRVYPFTFSDNEGDFYSRILRYVVIRKAIYEENFTILQFIRDIIKQIAALDKYPGKWIGSKKALYMAAYETLHGVLPHNVSEINKSIIYLYKILNKFFLLARTPAYSYKELLHIVGTDDKLSIATMELIGAFLGFDVILAQNIKVGGELTKFVGDKINSTRIWL